MFYILDFFSFLFGAIFSIWWIILPIMLAWFIWEKNLTTVRMNFLGKLEWVYMEIHIPPNVTRTPKAMEEVFNALHGVHRKGNKYMRYVEGFIPPYYVFELIGNNGKLRFVIRCLKEHKELVKTRIYSQYPEAKVEEIEDPLKDLPEKVPESTYNIFGTELGLIKDSAYPIRTYEVWEKLPEEQRIDPISALSEGASQLGEDEWVIIQIFGMPVPPDSAEWGDEWGTKGKKIVDKLAGRKEEEKERNPFEIIGEFIVNLILAPFRTPQWKEIKKEERQYPTQMQFLTPGEKEVLEAVEKKLSKPGFWGCARFAYIARKGIFREKMPQNVGLLFGYMKIFSAPHMNSLVRIADSMTSVDSPGYFIKERTFFRKRFLYSYIRGRWRSDFKFHVLTSDEMATLFHIPVEVVPAPGVERRVVIEKAPSADIPTL